MPYDETPELIDWEEMLPSPDSSRAFGFGPALALGTLTGLALLSGYGYSFCRPRHYYGWRDYYTCSPKYVCRPLPYVGDPQ